ncbi:transglycosylase SLT domain-containing protein [Aristophania vespae]|uniref:Transglycosylase SLT domain-containing protein n=1 Tax=Aristophania vespae TaxID=2697033 RepID=A0A6P1NIJ3_9PROT|nr:lytic transglycosylase domain-containing protein [Aristophania vespae]QHI95482.1 transglycosylase SLT domain-containing protein [Aristophania vespae]
MGLVAFPPPLMAQASPYSPRLTEWLTLTSPGATGFPVQKYGDFLKIKPEWPLQTRIVWRFENALNHETDPSVLKKYCPIFPLTQLSTIIHCDPFLHNAADQARKLWREGLSDNNNEQNFLKTYRTNLTIKDNWIRYQNLEKKGLKLAASRQIKRLTLPQQTLAQARFSQRFSLNNADQLFAIVDSQQQDPTLIRLRLNYLRRNNRFDEGFNLWQEKGLKLEKTTLKDPTLWAFENLAYARYFMGNNNTTDNEKALNLLAPLLTFPKMPIQHEAFFLSGYVSLVSLKNPAQAEIFFQHLAQDASVNIRAKGFYWLGRCAEFTNNSSQAQSFFNQAAAYPTSFYGQYALAHITHSPFFAIEQRSTRFKSILHSKLTQLKALQGTTISRLDLSNAARELAAQGDTENSTIFMTYLYAHTPHLSEQVSVAHLSLSLNVPKAAILASRKLARAGEILYPEGHPLPYNQNLALENQKLVSLPKGLLPALVRQESSGDPQAISPSPAYGLTQLRLPTAQEVSRKHNVGTVSAPLLLDPQTNLLIGSFYLSELLTRFNGIIPYTLAAYNAGPTRVSRLNASQAVTNDNISKMPQTDDENLLTWTINFPLKETRLYIEHIMTDVAFYE